MTTPLPLSVDLTVLYGAAVGNPFTAYWYDTFDTVPTSAKVAVLDQSSRSHSPGLYVVNSAGVWVLAVPYNYVDNYITAGLEAKIEVSPSVATTAPVDALLFKNGVLVPGLDITAGVDTWAWMLIDSVSLPRAVDPATSTTLGGVIVPAESGLVLESSGSLSAQVNQAVEFAVVANTWYPITIDQARNKIIKLTGDISAANANMQLPAGATGVWYVDNQTTSTTGTSVSWGVFGTTGPLAYMPPGKSGFVRVSSTASTSGVVAIFDPDVHTVAGVGPVNGNIALTVTDIGAAPSNSPTFTGPSTFNGTAILGAKGNSQELDIGMGTTFARLRERATADDFAITTNVDIGGTQDNVAKSSWSMSMGSGSDQFSIGRMPAGNAGGPKPPSMFEIDNAGQLLASSAYTPSQAKSLVTKDYVDTVAFNLPAATTSTLGGIKIGTGLSIDSSDVVSTTYLGTKFWIASPWITTQWTQMLPYGLNYPAGAPGLQFITNSAPTQDMFITFGLVGPGLGSFDSPTVIGTIKIPAFSVTPDTSQFAGQTNTAVGTLLVVNCNLAQSFSFSLPTTVWTVV